MNNVPCKVTIDTNAYYAKTDDEVDQSDIEEALADEFHDDKFKGMEYIAECQAARSQFDEDDCWADTCTELMSVMAKAETDSQYSRAANEFFAKHESLYIKFKMEEEC